MTSPTLDALVKELDALHAKLPKGDFAFVTAIRDAWPRIRTALSSTQARADKLEAELAAENQRGEKAIGMRGET